jgi:hypothetical protein
MKKVFVILLTFATIGVLFFVINSRTSVNQSQNSVKAGNQSTAQAQTATPSQPAQNQAQTNSNQPMNYTDPQQNFKVSVPAGFSDTGQASHYEKYFGNQAKDVEMNIAISMGEYSSASDLQNQAKIDGATISNVASLTVDGVSASQQLEDNMNATNPDDKGCAIATYFAKNGKIYDISMYSASGCTQVNSAKADYDSLLNSFLD